ncbi:MAG TPA: nicotinate phosphoribosyltransferase [Pirellulales bacterium]|nr:nicotinate phosphoribosyltransferase [Pirellulales bacterium]
MNRAPNFTSGLLTDLYQFTMVQGYLECGLTDTAVFELSVRNLPRERNFLLAAGLEQLVEFFEQASFSPGEIGWLARQGFGRKLLDYLSSFRFTGQVHAMPEGTVFFAGEPILRVTAPLAEAQLLETRAINILHFQTLIASKAIRCVLAAPGKQLVDFGLRRAHGAEAGLMAARASYLAGFAGTSTVLAGQLWNVPVFGTMAHSFVEAHDDELVAFEHFAQANPRDVTLILDSYDTQAAARKVVVLADRLSLRGISVSGVRIDSGDLAAHARGVRQILDRAGLQQVRILASGGLDEHHLARLVAARAPIDGFGVGTRLDVSADAPYLDGAYKLVEYAGRPRRKHSEGKATWPGRKQVVRHHGPDGLMAHDRVALEDESQPTGQQLLVEVMREGRRTADESLAQIRQRVHDQIEQLPESWKSLAPAAAYPVERSSELIQLGERWDQEHRPGGAAPPWP